jgi:hypothetical protein
VACEPRACAASRGPDPRPPPSGARLALVLRPAKGWDLRLSAQTQETKFNNPGLASYSIAGRSLNRYAMADLLALRSRLQAEVAREDAAAAVAAGGFDRRRIYVRFGA